MSEKIISEKVNVPFEEVEEEETEEEKEEADLEEEIEPEEPESFTDFTTEAVAPVLETIPIPDTSPEPLEQEIENVPSTPGTVREESLGAYTVYNMPEYGREYETSERERQEREVEIKNLSAPTPERETLNLRNLPQEDFTQLSAEERAEREIRKYQEIRRIEEIERERRPPFERRERKRERILK